VNIAIFIALLVVLIAALVIIRLRSKNNVNSIVKEARMRAAERSSNRAYASTQPMGIDLATSLSTSVIEGDANLLSDEQKAIIQTLFDGKAPTEENITMDVYRNFWRNTP